MSEELCHSLK